MPRFPSIAWFEQVARAHSGDRERLRRLGYVDAHVGIAVTDSGRQSGFVLEFAGYGVGSVRESANPVSDADFTIIGPLATWREMIENIQANGGPDLAHTLNRLTMAGTPLTIIAEDQLKQDVFFRFNQSFQSYFDAGAAVPTEFDALMPA